MNKLEERFEDSIAEIMMEHGDGHIDGCEEISKYVTKEAKDIAYEFCKYFDTHKGSGRFCNVMDYFDEFIEEKYGR